MYKWIFEHQDLLYTLAAIFALLSFLITAFIPKISSEISQEQIEKKIDSAIEISVNKTISEITNEIEGVIEKVDSNALTNIETVKKESKNIISDLKTETEELKGSLSIINADTKEIIDIKDAENIRIVIEFEIKNTKDDVAINQGWQFFVENYLNQTFSLKFYGKKFKGTYEIKNKGFSRMMSMYAIDPIYSTNKNLYFIPEPFGNPTPNLKFIVGLNLVNIKRQGKIHDIESGDDISLIASRTFDIDNDFYKNMSSVIINNMKIKISSKEWISCKLWESRPDGVTLSWGYRFKII